MKKTIALLIFPGAQSLDITGPMDVFSEANRFLLPENQYQLEVIGVERGLLSCSNGLLIQAHRHFSEANDVYDLLLVVGGPALAQQEMHQDVYDWLSVSSQRARRFGSICNGAFLLARAGLLNGRVITTHWNDAATLAGMFPATQVEADRIFIQDGALYTSAGVTAGIDLSLYLLAQDHGAEVALNVAKRLVVFTQRAGGQSQFSPYLTPYAEAASLVAQVQKYVLDHLSEDLTLPVLSNVANMSSRNFSRLFMRDAKITPAQFVESARVDASRVLLESSAVPLKTIAFKCGFGNAHSMRAAFVRRLGVSPQQYRLNFSRVL
ncbi:MAG: araC family transcriptional regulator [Herbaspirillum sp.]|nr:araC family transcriptional regulator [Herbaspirillum sp.]